MTESAFLALQQEANRRSISLNTLHNLLMLSFAEHDRFLNEFRMVKLSTVTFRKILMASTDEAIVEAGRSAGRNVPKSFILAKDRRLSEGSCVEYMRLMGQYGGLFQFNIARDETGTTITLVHELGDKGSLFLSEYARSVFELVGVKAKVTLSESSVTLDLLRPSRPSG